MSERTLDQIAAYIAELERRAAKSRIAARRTLNPLFTRDERKRPPRDFVESSFLYMRACDADLGSRPVPCPVFWLSPDLRVAPLDNLGLPTRELDAGTTYRLTATIRNRGDLTVPSAKVEFYLVNPTLGFDARFATKIGVADGWVQAHGATEVSLDYAVPPSLSGHRCLFARVFSFSPLDIPLDDYALNPLIDRHVAQLNLNIVAQASTFTLDWVHLRNAHERLEVVPMSAAIVRTIRNEAVTGLTLASATRWREMQGGLAFDVERGDGRAVETRQTETGLELVSRDREAFPLDRQAVLTKRVQAALKAMEKGRGETQEFKALFKEFRTMNSGSARTRVTLELPEFALKPGQAVALNLIRRDVATGEATGGIGVFIAGPPR